MKVPARSCTSSSAHVESNPSPRALARARLPGHTTLSPVRAPRKPSRGTTSTHPIPPYPSRPSHSGFEHRAPCRDVPRSLLRVFLGSCRLARSRSFHSSVGRMRQLLEGRGRRPLAVLTPSCAGCGVEREGGTSTCWSRVPTTSTRLCMVRTSRGEDVISKHQWLAFGVTENLNGFRREGWLELALEGRGGGLRRQGERSFVVARVLRMSRDQRSFISESCRRHEKARTGSRQCGSRG